MPPRKKADPPPKPTRRPANMGSVIVRADGRIAVRLPKDLDPDRKLRYGPGQRKPWQSVDEATVWLDATIVAGRSKSPEHAGADELLGAYLLRWWKLGSQRWPKRTADSYLRSIRHFRILGDTRVGDLTHEHVLSALAAIGRSRWRRHRRGKDGKHVAHGPSYPYTVSTIRQARSVFHTALEELVPHVLPFNPCKRATMARQQPTTMTVWDAEQLDRFEAKVLEIRPDLYFPIRLVTRRALRRGEVLAVESDDLDMRRRVVTIDETAGDRAGETGDTKGRRLRDIPLGELAGEAQLHLAKRRSRPSRWMVPGRTVDKPFSMRQFDVVVKQIAEVAGLPPITPKDMRATAATILLDQNVSLARVSRLLGHSSIAVTSRFYERAVTTSQARIDQLATDFDAAFRRASDAVTEPETASEVSAEVSDESATR